MSKAVVIIPTYNEIENAENIIRAVMNIPHPLFDVLIAFALSLGFGRAFVRLFLLFRFR